MIFDDISQALQKGRKKDVEVLVQQAIDEKYPVKDILDKGLLSGMDIIGAKFKNNEIYVPDVLVAARAMNAGATLLKPLLVEQGIQSIGKVIIGTVLGDLHDIGKNLVKMMMEGKGFEVIDLGVNIPADQFVQSAIDNNAEIIACSALLTTTMGEMANVVKVAIEKGVRDKVTIMVGGAPVNEAYKNSIGADIYTPDAASAAEEAAKVVLN